MPGLLSPYLSKKRSEIALPYLKGDVLDIGCGPANNLVLLNNLNIPYTSYTGLEYDPIRVASLKEKYQEAEFFAINLDSETIPMAKKFDTIVLLAVVEHIFNLKFLFGQLSTLLKDNGSIIVTTPTPFGNDIVHRFGTKLGLFDKEGGQDDHIVIFNKKRLDILGNEVGLRLVSYHTFQLGCNQLAVFSPIR